MPDEISPEDRERLARTKFGEWFNEYYEKRFAEDFDKRVTEIYTAAGQQVPKLSGGTGSPPAQQQQQQSGHKRRSAFEICISDMLGIG